MGKYFGKVCEKHPELIGERVSANKSCIGCHRANTARWREKNPEKAKAQSAAYLPEWRKRNKEKIREDGNARMAAWRSANHEKVKAKANSPEMQAYRAARRSKERRATPAWANSYFISEIYDMAVLKTKAFGFKWHVDHIVPLQSKLVCGLHCEANLQIIPASENFSKGNRHWPDM